MKETVDFDKEYFLGYYSLYEAVPAKARKSRSKVSPKHPGAVQPDTPEAAQERLHFSFRQKPRKQVVRSPHFCTSSSHDEVSMYAPLWTSPRRQTFPKGPVTSAAATAAASVRPTATLLKATGWAGAGFNPQVRSQQQSLKVTAADRLASSAKRAAQFKGKAIAHSPLRFARDTTEFAAPAEAQASPGSAPSDSSASRGSPSSSSALTHESFSELRHCACCYSTETPTWRNGRVAPYAGLLLCNACQMWEGRHRGHSLYDTPKRDAYRQQYQAKCLVRHASVDGSAGVGDTSLQAPQQLQQGSIRQRREGRRGSHTSPEATSSQGPSLQPSGNLSQDVTARAVQPIAALQHSKKRKRTANAAEDSAVPKLARRGSSSSPGAAAMSQASGDDAGAAVAEVVRQPSSTTQLRPRLYKRLTEDRWFQEEENDDEMWEQ